MRSLFVAFGVIALLIGVVWTLQGADVLLGSFMSGSPVWLSAGVVLVVLGAAVVALGARTSGAKKAA